MLKFPSNCWSFSEYKCISSWFFITSLWRHLSISTMSFYICNTLLFKRFIYKHKTSKSNNCTNNATKEISKLPHRSACNGILQRKLWKIPQIEYAKNYTNNDKCRYRPFENLLESRIKLNFFCLNLFFYSFYFYRSCHDLIRLMFLLSSDVTLVLKIG